MPGQVCGSRPEILRQLAAGYREAPVAVGILEGGGAVLELLASPDGATFTLLVTIPPTPLHPEGRSCLAAAGQDWQAVAAPSDDEAL